MNSFDGRPRGFVPPASPGGDVEPTIGGFGFLDDDELRGASSDDYLAPTAAPGHSNRRPWPTRDPLDPLFTKVWANWHLREGGYAEDPKDPRGPTNMGMSQMTLEQARTKYDNAPNSVRDMTVPQVQGYLYREHYLPSKIPKIAEIVGVESPDETLARQIFDISGHHGPATAGKWLQESLNSHLDLNDSKTPLAVDGVIGSGTLRGVREAKRLNLIPVINDAIVEMRVRDIRRKSTSVPQYTNEWLDRASQFRMGR